MSPPRRGICHQCGRSFELRPPASVGGASLGAGRGTPTELPDLVCRHCGSEFVELLELKRARSREDRAEAEPPSEPECDDEDGDEQADEDGWHDREEHGDAYSAGDYGNYGRRRVHPIGGGGSSGFVIQSFPGGILLRGGTLPMAFGSPPGDEGVSQLSFTEYHAGTSLPVSLTHCLSTCSMIRFVVNPGSFPPEHPIWRTVGFRGNPADYVFSEDAFQTALSSLMDQTGMRTVGLTEEQLDDLERVIWGHEGGPRDETDGDERQAGHFPSGQSPASAEGPSPACAICQEPYKEGEETIVLACKHQFHADCICPWLAKVASCPICRHDPLKRG